MAAPIPVDAAIADAMASVETALGTLDQHMPPSRFKSRVLRQLTLYLADWRYRAGRRTCKRCDAEWYLTAGEASWAAERGFPVPTHCRACRRQRRAEREQAIGPVPAESRDGVGTR